VLTRRRAPNRAGLLGRGMGRGESDTSGAG
jgi:hypothetical protein